ncbi:MAG TPA: hypothetical protein VJZ27_09645, partial [Aggregatilineales bacterium]|nr:hypothetical protein [Aggregatilineales bacterium]
IPRHSAALLTVENSETIEVPAGQTAQIDALQATVTVIKTTDELVKNSLFLNTTEPGVPDGWGCFSISENPDAVRGINQLQTVEGRRAMHIERRGETLGYGETGCLQLLGERQEGLDVSAYRTLRIRASLNIRWHSLAICGSQASECALMLELTYLNEFGQKQRWIHGFYTFEHTNPDLPRACNSCLLEHDRITAGNWYIFESQNLFELPEGFRPTRLEKIRFYAAGHEYEVLVDEVAVLGER